MRCFGSIKNTVRFDFRNTLGKKESQPRGKITTSNEHPVLADSFFIQPI
ncbi:hypothetical protein GXM_04957 [Nostoc sphaeroides CCNUC1]|uniref:Uncharacterized protein n=1 Tax=Nostoc sphaeroides CCNUC1 TaxID=2653204 RepID=A0A5P8W403_9NOSO|nr:hypothetical protein GXM_04957 [Nostoc sphaeroides CCNUC1]